MELTFYALASALLGLAIVDSINPSALLMTGYILMKAPQERRTRMVFAYVAGILGIYFALGVFLVLGLDALLTIAGPLGESQLLLYLQALLGSGMLVWSLMPARPRTASNRFRPKSFSYIAMLSLGAAITFAELITAFPYFAAAGLLQQATVTLELKLGLLAVYNLIFVAPPLIMLAIYKINESRVESWLVKRQERRNKEQTDSNLRWLVGIVGFMIGASAVAELF